MSTFDPFRTASHRLAPLMAHEEDLQALWRPEELRALWKHQLATAIEFDLGGLDEQLAARLNSLAAPSGAPVRTFGALLEHPSPPVELLELVKRFAKAHVTHPQSLLPREISQGLYFAAIAAALLRCRKHISALNDETLRGGLQRVIARAWLDQSTRALLEEALAVVQSREHKS